MVKLDRIEHTVELPEGVSATIDGDMITITGLRAAYLENLQVQDMMFSKKAAL